MKKHFDRLGWFILSVALLVNCFPRTEEIKQEEEKKFDVFDQSKAGTRQVAITPTGNGFFKVISGVPVGGVNNPVGAPVDLGTGDVTGTLPVPRGGTGITSLGAAGQGLCVNGSATGYAFCTFGGGGGGSSAGASGTVQLSDGAGGFIAATNVIGGVSFLNVGNGTSSATAGQVRVPNNVTALAADNATHSANLTLAASDSSNNAWYGSTPGGTSQPANAYHRAVSNVYIGTQSTDQLKVTPGEIDAMQTQNFAVLGSQTSASYGGGQGVIYLGAAYNPPTTAPAHGGLFYEDSSTPNPTIRYVGPTGLKTQLDGGVRTITMGSPAGYTLNVVEASYNMIWMSGRTNGTALYFPAPANDDDSYVRWVHAGRDVACSPSGSCLGSMTINMLGGGRSVPITTDEYSIAVLVIRSIGVIKLTTQTQL